MTERFRVKLFDAGVWDGRDDRLVEADMPQQAAEVVAGRPLVPNGAPARLRAQVRRVGNPVPPLMFCEPPSLP
jgi:hypothetical protein